MKNKIGVIILGLGMVILIGGATVLYNYLGDKVATDSLKVEEDTELNEENKTEEFTKAFDFTVYDEAGESYKLSEFEGKPVVLNFWASWCGPCKSEMPDFQEAYQRYGEDIHFLIVNMTDGYQETMEKALTFISENGYNFPVYYDTDMEAAKAYRVYSIPTTYFIDKDGYIIAQGRGALDKETLQTGIDYIYSE